MMHPVPRRELNIPKVGPSPRLRAFELHLLRHYYVKVLQSARLLYVGSKFNHSPTNRSPFSNPSLIKRSSRSRMFGCFKNCKREQKSWLGQLGNSKRWERLAKRSVPRSI